MLKVKQARSLRSNLLWQVWLALSVLVVVSVSLLGFISVQQIGRDTRESIEESLRSQLILLNDLYAPRVALLAEPEPRAFEIADHPDRVTLIALDGTVLADSREDAGLMDNHLNRPEIQALIGQGTLLGSATRFSTTLNQEMLYFATLLTHKGDIVGYARISRPLSSVDEKVNQFQQSILLVAGLLIMFALIAGLFLARRITLPISEMRRISARMADGEFDLRVPIQRNDEFGALGNALNQLAGVVERRIRDLTRNRNELEAILEGLEEGVIAIDHKQRVIHINSVAQSLLDLAVDESAKINLLQLHIDAQLRELVSDFFREESNQFKSLKISGKTIAASILRSGGPSFEGAIIVLRDVSEMRRLERARTDFVANASHELKTPIAALKGFIDTLVEDEEMPAETATHFLSRSQAQVSRLQGVVTDLLQLSRLESKDEDHPLSRIDLQALLIKVFQEKLQDALLAGIELSLEGVEHLVEVSGEQEALEQLFSNLIDNAIKYSAVGGRVKVCCEVLNRSVNVRVVDQGIGIPEADLARIFERFYRVDRARSRDKGGTGLGLSIVKHIAELHGGSVQVESILGEGSTFSVSLPADLQQGNLSL